MIHKGTILTHLVRLPDALDVLEQAIDGPVRTWSVAVLSVSVSGRSLSRTPSSLGTGRPAEALERCSQALDVWAGSLQVAAP